MKQRQNADWEQLRQRLSHSRLTLSQTIEENPERAPAVLRRRAQRLARHGAPATAVQKAPSVVVFRLGKERYAIEIAKLIAVRAFAGSTPVPSGRRFVLGVINFRGEIRPVVDLAAVLKDDPNSSQAGGTVIVVRADSHEIGLKVDEVEDVRQIPPDNWVSSEKGPAAFVQAITEDALMLVNPDDLLSRMFS